MKNEGTGHYYCFIYEDKKQCWYKFNDSIVTKVNEEEVFKQSYGEQNDNCNACCLFYKNSQTKVNPNKPVEISARLKAEVQKRDQPFLEKIDEIKIRRKFLEIEQDYNEYIKDILNTTYVIQQNKNGDNIFLPFISSSNIKLYLLNQKDEKIKSYGKRLVLMETIEKKDLKELEQGLTKKDNLYQGISLFYEHMKSTQGIQGQMLSDPEKQFYIQQEQAYSNLLSYLEQMSNIMNDTNNFAQSFRMLGCIRRSIGSIKNVNMQNQQLVLLKLNIRYIHDVLLLKCCFMIDKYLHQSQLPNAFTLLNILILTYLSFYYTPKQIQPNNSSSSSAAAAAVVAPAEFDPQNSTFQTSETNTFISGQVFNNLKQTIQNFASALDSDSKSKFDGQLSLMQTPENFPASKQRIASMFEDIEMNKGVNVMNNDIVYQAYDQYEIFIKKQEVWIKQLEYLRTKRMYIPQEERLNQEEVLYFE